MRMLRRWRCALTHYVPVGAHLQITNRLMIFSTGHPKEATPIFGGHRHFLDELALIVLEEMMIDFVHLLLFIYIIYFSHYFVVN